MADANKVKVQRPFQEFDVEVAVRQLWQSQQNPHQLYFTRYRDRCFEGTVEV
jgi:hypothetical protein